MRSRRWRAGTRKLKGRGLVRMGWGWESRAALALRGMVSVWAWHGRELRAIKRLRTRERRRAWAGER